MSYSEHSVRGIDLLFEAHVRATVNNLSLPMELNRTHFSPFPNVAEALNE